jgi:hypothetical protein
VRLPQLLLVLLPPQPHLLLLPLLCCLECRLVSFSLLLLMELLLYHVVLDKNFTPLKL